MNRQAFRRIIAEAEKKENGGCGYTLDIHLGPGWVLENMAIVRSSEMANFELIECYPVTASVGAPSLFVSLADVKAIKLRLDGD